MIFVLTNDWETWVNFKVTRESFFPILFKNQVSMIANQIKFTFVIA